VAAKRTDQKAIRVYVDADIYSLLKRLAGVREQSLNHLMNGMIEDWLALDEQQETIERHRLDEFGEDEDVQSLD
jgi:hypothetical protein